MPDDEQRPGGRPESRAAADRVAEERDRRTGRAAARARMEQQQTWVDLQVRQAMERGDFDDLPGAGKPIDDLGTSHDPDWWVKQLIERERVTGVLPPALQLRKDDAELDAALDRLTSERQVRDELAGFNRRVVEARRQLQGGPPVITPTRDVDAEVEQWRERRRARFADRGAPAAPPPTRGRRRRRR
ncbi:DUF1992 domain-containing protein [Nocardioides sp. GXQ0305]|uniref:DnaJ family domain-containing protein n=1 Tax=Nocardioides sp. GXQ0305 TaxID=3423912 RepID=UPI003D7D9124